MLPLSAAPRAEAEEHTVTSSQAEGIWELCCSPDGGWLAFEAVPGAAPGTITTNAMLYTVRVSGGPWIPITDGRSWDDKPRWSPDGMTIYYYYVSLSTGSPNVWGSGSIPSGVAHSGGRLK